MIYIFPTETSYGIGCDARDAAAVRKVFEIKKRAPEKSVPLIAANAEMVAKYVDAAVWQNLEVERAVQNFWPGALTLVLPANDFARRTLAPQTIAADNTIAIRVSGHAAARDLSAQIGAPIVATSANVAGDPAAYTAADAQKLIGVDTFLDGGDLPLAPASTIVRFTNNTWEIIRQGSIKL